MASPLFAAVGAVATALSSRTWAQMFAAYLVCYEWCDATAQFGKNHQGDRNEFLPSMLRRVKPVQIGFQEMTTNFMIYCNVLALAHCKPSNFPPAF